MKRNKVFALLLVIVIIASVLVFYNIGTRNQNNQIQTGVSVGEKAPIFTLNDTSGNEFGLEDFRGKVVLIEFMSTSCIQCETQASYLVQIDEEFSSSNLEIISISISPSDTESQLQAIKNDLDADWRFANGVDVGGIYEITDIPTILIIDEDGVIQHRSGLISESSLRSELEDLI